MNGLLRISTLALAASFTLPALAQTTETEAPPQPTTYGDPAARPYDADRDGRYDTRAVNESDWFGPQGGEWEMTIAGAGSSDKDAESGDFNISVDLSSYISEMWSIGLRQDVGYADVANGPSTWNGGTTLFTQLHFGDTPFRPFIGAGIGYLYGDNVTDTWYGGPEAGLRYYVKPETFIFARAAYQFLFDSADDIDDQFDDGRFVYTLGVGFTF